MIIWLASYPRSGNSIVRIILYHVFGIETYSIYNDPLGIGADPATADIVGHRPLPADFQQNPGGIGSPIRLIKTHEYPPDHNKAIYILRDGRDAITSYFYYHREIVRKPVALHEIIKGTVGFGSWSDHVNAWSPLERQDTLLLRFEALTQDSAAQIEALATFIGREPIVGGVPSFAQLQAINRRFFRSGRSGTWKNTFTERDHELFERLHGDVMSTYGYECDYGD